MGKHLELYIHGVVDDGNLVDGELSRKRDAICTGLFAPGGAPGVVNIRLCRYMGLHLGHEAANLKKQAPVLDDEGIGTELPATVDKRERLGHLLVFDDDVDGHIDTRPSEMRRTAGCLECLVSEVVGLASGVERPHAAVDGIRAGRERRVKWFGPARRREEFRFGRIRSHI